MWQYRWKRRAVRGKQVNVSSLYRFLLLLLLRMCALVVGDDFSRV